MRLQLGARRVGSRIERSNLLLQGLQLAFGRGVCRGLCCQLLLQLDPQLCQRPFSVLLRLGELGFEGVPRRPLLLHPAD